MFADNIVIFFPFPRETVSIFSIKKTLKSVIYHGMAKPLHMTVIAIRQGASEPFEGNER